MKQELLRCEVVPKVIKQSPPAQIIAQVLGGSAAEVRLRVLVLESFRYALSMVDALAASAVEGRNEGTRFDLQRLERRPIGALPSTPVLSAGHSASVSTTADCWATPDKI